MPGMSGSRPGSRLSCRARATTDCSWNRRALSTMTPARLATAVASATSASLNGRPGRSPKAMTPEQAAPGLQREHGQRVDARPRPSRRGRRACRTAGPACSAARDPRMQRPSGGQRLAELADRAEVAGEPVDQPGAAARPGSGSTWAAPISGRGLPRRGHQAHDAPVGDAGHDHRRQLRRGPCRSAGWTTAWR